MFQWSEEQEMVRQAVRDFVDREIRPLLKQELFELAGKLPAFIAIGFIQPLAEKTLRGNGRIGRVGRRDTLGKEVPHSGLASAIGMWIAGQHIGSNVAS